MQKSSMCSVGFLLTAALMTTGCDRGDPEVVPQVRAIKNYTVTELATGQSRKFSGKIYAADSSTLSFQVRGNVHEMRVNQGDNVTAGQVLAVLDKQPYELDVQSAKAELQEARAKLTQATQEYGRQETLFKKGWIAESRLDVVLRSRDSAISRVDLATSKLALAQRDLRLTELTAPYDGSISRKYIEAFVEVQAGQQVYEIEAAGALEVRFDIPESTISRITLGMPATVAFPTQPGRVLRARITEIGSSAGEANAFPIKAALEDPPPQVRTGMTAEAEILIERDGAASAYLVPLAAIAPGDRTNAGYVFVYDAATRTVKKNPVTVEAVTDNFAHVLGGVKAGDVLATAGVPFLNDGQEVTLMAEQAPGAIDLPTVKR